jgi:hypothetical protein
MHHSKKDSNSLIGVGGIKCHCCAPQSVKGHREIKRALNKRIRRTLDKDQAIEEGEFFNYWVQLDPSDVTGESAMNCMDYVVERDIVSELGGIYIANFKPNRFLR